MSGESGRFFNINGVGSVMSATINEQITLEEYVASNTGGGTASGGGIIDWTATASGKGGTPPIFPNEELALLLYSNPDSGVEGGDGQRTLGTGICSEISVTWNNEGNQLTSWTANFASRSSLTRDVGAPSLDTSALSQDYPCGTFPTFDAVEFPAITTATLTITANLSQANNSSTRDANGCFIQNNAGPINWKYSATQQDYRRDTTAYPDLGANGILKLPVNDTEFWQLTWGKWQAYSGLTFNTDGTPISRTLNVTMNANDGTGIGSIYAPGNVLKWGVAPV